MDHTNLISALRALCEKRPEFRRKLAVELQAQTKTAGIDDDYMSWEALQKVTVQAPQILQLLRDSGEDLEDWQEHKVQLAAEYLDAVFDSLMYGRDFE